MQEQAGVKEVVAISCKIEMPQNKVWVRQCIFLTRFMSDVYIVIYEREETWLFFRYCAAVRNKFLICGCFQYCAITQGLDLLFGNPSPKSHTIKLLKGHTFMHLLDIFISFLLRAEICALLLLCYTFSGAFTSGTFLLYS